MPDSKIAETWKPVIGFEDNYLVSNLGRVAHVLRRHNVHGRDMLCLDRRSYQLVHRLVAAAFIGPCPEGKEVNHINGVPHDNRVENLEYLTRKENVHHAIRLGLILSPPHPKGEDNGRAKLTDENVRSIRKEREAGATIVSIAKKYQIGTTTVGHILHRDTWRHVA